MRRSFVQACGHDVVFSGTFAKLRIATISLTFVCPCIVSINVNDDQQDATIFYEITNRCNYMQSILFHCWVHSTCFGCFTHPSSGVQFLTVSTATGTNHSIVSATYSQCWICGECSGIGTIHVPSTSVFPSRHHSTSATYSFICHQCCLI